MFSGTKCCLFLLVLIICTFTYGQTESSFYPDSLDVYIFNETDHLWNTFGKDIWPGYKPAELPVLLYRSPGLHWLMDHPSPPGSFTALDFLNTTFYIYNLPESPLWSHFSATIWPINGVWTTILPSSQAWLEFCRGHNIPEKYYPPDQLVMIALHERFHAYQIQWLEPDFKNIFELDDFSKSSEIKIDSLLLLTKNSPVAVLCLEEQKALYNAYQEKDPEKSKQYIKQFTGLREKRAALMSNKQRQAENYMELVEGIAKYLEIRLAMALQEPYTPIKAMNSHNSFRAYQNAKQAPLTFIDNVRDGDLTDNRVYSTGSVICLLLDRFSGTDWKHNIFSNYQSQKINLVDLLKQTIR